MQPYMSPGAAPADDAINGAYLGTGFGAESGAVEVGSAQQAAAGPVTRQLPNASATLVWWIVLFAILVIAHVLTLRFQG